METYKGVPYCQVVLLNDDKSLCLNIGFLGYTYDDVEKYLKLKFNRKAIICHRLEIAGGIFSDTKHSMPMT